MKKHEPTFLAPHSGLGTHVEGFKQRHQDITVHWHDYLGPTICYLLLDLHRLKKKKMQHLPRLLQAAYDFSAKQNHPTMSANTSHLAYQEAECCSIINNLQVMLMVANSKEKKKHSDINPTNCTSLYMWSQSKKIKGTINWSIQAAWMLQMLAPWHKCGA